MELIGAAIIDARDDDALPIHLVVPDRATADLLVSAADSVAGVELSRMRWQVTWTRVVRPSRSTARQPKLAEAINPHERVAVAFLLEDDRSRALKTRTPIVQLREVLARTSPAALPSTPSAGLPRALGNGDRSARAPRGLERDRGSVALSGRTAFQHGV